jgi:catechol 2,3-dioxygenase-like lactoylglutathione lyase family enzyme
MSAMKWLLPALWLLLPTSLTAQSAAQDSMPVAGSGSFFAVSVADLDASVRWYSEKLGLRVILRPPRSGPYAVAILEGPGLVVELLQLDQARPFSGSGAGGPGREAVHGLFKAGALIDGFDRIVALLRARGVEIVAGPFPARDGQRANLIFRDNAGNLIQLLGK